MTTEQEKMIDRLFETGSRLMDATAVLQRCIAHEGTPALKDLADIYFRALEEAMNAHTAIVKASVQS